MHSCRLARDLTKHSKQSRSRTHYTLGREGGGFTAAIGPAIGPCCYRVGSEVARQFGTWRPELAQVAEPTHIDLAGINETQLKNAGVTNIWQAGECTVCNHTRYFSFRREKEQAGRMLSFIGRVQMGGRAENTPGGCSFEEIRPETLRR